MVVPLLVFFNNTVTSAAAFPSVVVTFPCIPPVAVCAMPARERAASIINAMIFFINPYFLIAFEDKKLIKTRNNLILSSIHKAKGLEFEIVFFVYLDEGTLPYKENKDLVEEKRLFYVGITRAKKLLFLISSKQDGYSSFLEEIDKEFIQMRLGN